MEHNQTRNVIMGCVGATLGLLGIGLALAATHDSLASAAPTAIGLLASVGAAVGTIYGLRWLRRS